MWNQIWNQIVANIGRMLFSKTVFSNRNSVLDDNRESNEYAYGIEDEENRVSSKITIVIHG